MSNSPSKRAHSSEGKSKTRVSETTALLEQNTSNKVILIWVRKSILPTLINKGGKRL